MRKFILVLLATGLITMCQAEGNGGYAGSFLRIGLGARGIAMGNAQVASPEHGFGAYYNPAGLPYLKSFAANFSYSFLSLDRRFFYAGISAPIKPEAGFSAGWIYSGVGDIMGYDSRGVQTGNINNGLHAIYFSFGAMLIPGRLSAGVSAKYLLEKISDQESSYDYTGKGLGADLGLMFKVNSWLMLGYQLKDINSKLKSNTDKIFDQGMTLDNSFPLTSKVGFYLITPVKWVRVAYDFEWSKAGTEKNHAGLEFVIPDAALRIGYDADHLTLGGGVNIRTPFGTNTVLNYAFVNSVIDEGVSHVFSWEFAL